MGSFEDYKERARRVPSDMAHERLRQQQARQQAEKLAVYQKAQENIRKQRGIDWLNYYEDVSRATNLFHRIRREYFHGRGNVIRTGTAYSPRHTELGLNVHGGLGPGDRGMSSSTVLTTVPTQLDRAIILQEGAYNFKLFLNLSMVVEEGGFVSPWASVRASEGRTPTPRRGFGHVPHTNISDFRSTREFANYVEQEACSLSYSAIRANAGRRR